MNRIVFLLEEGSMGVLLQGLLPRLFPEMSFQRVPLGRDSKGASYLLVGKKQSAPLTSG